MKIRPVSDLHIEFSNQSIIKNLIPVIPNEKDMVIVLAGDITTGSLKQRWVKNWIISLAERHRALIYIHGNHEGYMGDHVTSFMNWKEIANRIPNMFVLENEIITIDDVCFLGTTLWTKLKQFPDEMLSKTWSDFIYIKGMTVTKWNALHEKAVKFIETTIQQTDKKIVVVTHHAPSPSSIAEQFENSSENCFYYTDLDRLMWYNPIKLWIHGHMHTSFDYVVGDEVQSTRVICNPYGYHKYAAINPKFDPNFIVNI